MNKSGFSIIYKLVGDKLRYGLKDKSGKTVLPCAYDQILDYDDDGYIRLIQDGIYATIDFECNFVIGFDRELTHLGVFHEGSARAQCKGNWGLVDVQGNVLGEFQFAVIKPFYKDGYRAVDDSGYCGKLKPNGEFDRNDDAPKFEYKGRFHHGIAPALIKDYGWIFINSAYERDNNYRYEVVDTVLRNGVYYVSPKMGTYGVARYDGTPLIGEWYDKPVKFENGVAVVERKHLDENGKEIREEDGQPLCDYGVLNLEGKYLFPMVYTSLHWNDYLTKNCFYAHNDSGHYLLFLNGERRKYRASSVCYDNMSPYIPESQIDKNINDVIVDVPSFKPTKLVERKVFRLFDKDTFLFQAGFEFSDSNKPIYFYYRDTDADINVKKLYKRGMIVRNHCFLDASSHLLRPVHKIRFMIASHSHIENKDYIKVYQERIHSSKYRGAVIPKDAYFVVMDVFVYMGVTQILLLSVPEYFAELVQKHDVSLKRMRIRCEGMDLKQFARADLVAKMGENVHGNSLSDYWVNAMSHPIGLDYDLKLNSLTSEMDYCTDEEMVYDCEWRAGFGPFLETSANYRLRQYASLSVVEGDLVRQEVDAIVNPTDSTLSAKGKISGHIHQLAGDKLSQACKKIGKVGLLSCVKTNGFNLPAKYVLHTVVPHWKSTQSLEDLRICYQKAIDIAREEKMNDLAFPFLGTGHCGFPSREAADVALSVIYDNLCKEEVSINITICCHSAKDAQLFKKLLPIYEQKYGLQE